MGIYECYKCALYQLEDIRLATERLVNGYWGRGEEYLKNAKYISCNGNKII